MQRRGGEGRAGRFWLSGQEPMANRGMRAPLAPPALVGAHGSAGEDLRSHGTCAPAAMARSEACVMVIGDGRKDHEGESSTGDWDGARVARPARGAQGDGRRAQRGSR
jgi:hypothetical protein